MLPNTIRQVYSSIFSYWGNLTIVSCVMKKNTAVSSYLSSMNHIDKKDGYRSKPEIVMHSNSTKGGLDTLDKLCSMYICRQIMCVVFSTVSVMWVLLVWSYMALVISRMATRNPSGIRFVGIIFLWIWVEIWEFTDDYINERLKNHKGVMKSLELLELTRKIRQDRQDTEMRQDRQDTKITLKRRCFICPRSRDSKVRQNCHVCSKNECSEQLNIQFKV